MRLYLGTHEVSWLARAGVPLMISRRRLYRRRTLPRALAPWILDSGGFTELTMRGRWSLKPAAYAAEIRRYADEIGQLAWAAPQDWMCEPFVLAKTLLSLAEHQRRTVASVSELRALGAPVIPVLQGWTLADYLACVEVYDRAGVDLRAEPVVGIGSVCRRQGTGEVAQVVRRLAGEGIRLHAFGAKTTGLAAYADALVSADSLAWSYRARRGDPLTGCTHASCQNCLAFAMAWRSDVLARVQPRLWSDAPTPPEAGWRRCFRCSGPVDHAGKAWVANQWDNVEAWCPYWLDPADAVEQAGLLIEGVNAVRRPDEEWGDGELAICPRCMEWAQEEVQTCVSA